MRFTFLVARFIFLMVATMTVDGMLHFFGGKFIFLMVPTMTVDGTLHFFGGMVHFFDGAYHDC